MRTIKRTSSAKTGAIRAVKAAGFALALLAGAPTAEPFVPRGQATQLTAQVIGLQGTEGWWIFKRCAGSCPGRGAYCCGTAV